MSEPTAHAHASMRAAMEEGNGVPTPLSNIPPPLARDPRRSRQFFRHLAAMFRPQPCAGEASNHDTEIQRQIDWIGGESELQTLLLVRNTYQPSIDITDDDIKLPADSRPFGYRDPALLGIRHTNATRIGTNELPLIKKLETLSGYRRVDLNLWFETFELEVSQLGVPIEQWVELLARHSDTAMSAHIDNLRRKLLSENTPPMPERLFYRAIRDMLFKDHGMACSAYTYRAWLTQITQGPPCSRHTSRGDGRNVHLRIHRCD